MVFSMGNYLQKVASKHKDQHIVADLLLTLGVNVTADIMEADDPALNIMRLFTVKPTSASKPQADLQPSQVP